VPYDDAVPAAVIAVHTFGNFRNFNSHLHIMATDGCIYGDGSFMVCPTPDMPRIWKICSDMKCSRC
jgi:hypothetical protein